MTVKDIIIKYLLENKLDGLCNPDCECGCGIDDFGCCGGANLEECQPAKKHICGNIKEEGCELDCDGECFKIDTDADSFLR